MEYQLSELDIAVALQKKYDYDNKYHEEAHTLCADTWSRVSLFQG